MKSQDRDHWDSSKGARIKAPEVDAFIEDVAQVCRKHGFSIAHEDGHGAFVIEPMDEGNLDWLRAAQINLEQKSIAKKPVPIFVKAIGVDNQLPEIERDYLGQ